MTLKKSTVALAAALCAALVFSGCASSMQTGSTRAKTEATGSAGGSNSQNANSKLQKCEQSMGTIAIQENTNSDWYGALIREYKLTSTVPLLKLLVQQSNCFVVVERGKGLRSMNMERELANSGELRRSSNIRKGQMVAADYTIVPSITFSQKGTSKSGGVVGALLGPVAGAIAGGISSSDASVLLTLVDNRSGVQLAAAEGSARNYDLALFGGVGLAGLGAGAGGYSNTPEGKVIVAAFTDSLNNLIISVKNYKTQNVRGGLGTGGGLRVQEY